MRKWKGRTWLGTGWSLLFVFVAFGRAASGQQAKPFGVPAAWVVEDPRLASPIKYQARHTAIGDVLSRLSKLSGVKIKAGERDGSADEAILVSIKDLKLADAMTAICSLMSYRKAMWVWQRESDRGEFVYRLTSPPAARDLGSYLRNWIQEAFEQQTMTLTRAARQNVPDRIADEKQIQAALFLSDEDFKQYREMLLRSGHAWAPLALFGSLVTPDVQLKVLRGESASEISMSSLTSSQLAQVSAIWPSVRLEPVLPGSLGGNSSKSLRFHTRRGPAGSTPALYIALVEPGAAMGYEAFPSLSLGQWYKKMLRNRWLLDGENDENDKDAARAGTPDPKSASLSAASPSLESRLMELAEGVEFSVFARLPRHSEFVPGSPVGQRVEQFFANIPASPLMTKWRGDVLLVSTTDWPQDEAALVPQSLVRRLRGVAQRNRGWLELDDLADLARTLRPEQLRTLATEFPVMAGVADLQPLLASYAASPLKRATMRSTSGAAIDDELQTAMRDSAGGTLFHLWRARGGAKCAIRLLVRDIGSPEKPRREIMFNIESDGRDLGGAGFTYEPVQATR